MLFAIQSAAMTTTVLVLSAGKTALLSSVMMVLSATSPNHMDVELVQSTSVTTVRSGVLFGTLNAVKTSTMSLAVFAHLTAHLA